MSLFLFGVGSFNRRAGCWAVLTLDVAFAQSVDEATQLNQQAIQLYQQGRYADAEPLFKRALAIRKGARSRPSRLATTLNNLA